MDEDEAAGNSGDHTVSQHFPDDTTSERYGFRFDPDGPQRAGRDITPDLCHSIWITRDMILFTEQSQMSSGAVAHYRNGGEQLVKLTPSGEGEQRPVIATYEGRKWLADGSHRVAASRLRGEAGILGWHTDVDEDMRNAGRITSLDFPLGVSAAIRSTPMTGPAAGKRSTHSSTQPPPRKA